MTDTVDLVVVTMTFDAVDGDRLVGVLANYVVLSRGHEGCRNIDLCSSSLTDDRFVVISKWDSPEAQRAHFDSPAMVAMAGACRGILAGPPRIELWEGISAHDLA